MQIEDVRPSNPFMYSDITATTSNGTDPRRGVVNPFDTTEVVHDELAQARVKFIELQTVSMTTFDSREHRIWGKSGSLETTYSVGWYVHQEDGFRVTKTLI